MFKSFAFAVTALATAAAAAPAAAQNRANPVQLDSEVFVERTSTDADGRTRTTLEAPRSVVPGDRLVFVLNYANTGQQAATNFTITNPLPSAVRFAGAADAGATVSIDGGRNWGALESLRVREADGTTRAARAEDVTHIRWAFSQPIPVGQSGRVTFRGVVR